MSPKVIERARQLRSIFPFGEAVLLLNDRVDLCEAASFDGVHVGQNDLSVDMARRILGTGRVIGVSTHNSVQVQTAERSSADYVAIGPVFETGSKDNPDPVTGLGGVREARRLTGKPLVAIGGITAANGREVLRAGADAVAVISGLLPSVDRSGNAPEIAEIVRDFLASLR